jgi:hypothetical protein
MTRTHLMACHFLAVGMMSAFNLSAFANCIALASFCLFATLHAQKPKNCVAGVYKTKEDLVGNTISHRVNTADKGYSFGFLFPADLKLTIKVTTPDTTLEFKPGSVYGYSECGKKYRYYKGGDLLVQEDFYGIEETGPLVIYSSAMVSGNEKFYSRDLGSPIRRLQQRNLEEDFKSEPEFLEAAKKLKRQEVEDLAGQDEQGRYLVNKIYREKVKRNR